MEFSVDELTAESASLIARSDYQSSNLTLKTEFLCYCCPLKQGLLGMPILTKLDSFMLTLARLTLTAADRVHIVEPQWNPSVEQQAIGRALRIGQTRKVTIVKYIVQDTVEEV